MAFLAIWIIRKRVNGQDFAPLENQLTYVLSAGGVQAQLLAVDLQGVAGQEVGGVDGGLGQAQELVVGVAVALAKELALAVGVDGDAEAVGFEGGQAAAVGPGVEHGVQLAQGLEVVGVVAGGDKLQVDAGQLGAHLLLQMGDLVAVVDEVQLQRQGAVGLPVGPVLAQVLQVGP